MSRLHSSGKGQHGSKKPSSKTNPEWVEYKPKEVIELIISLSNQGFSPSEIGTTLRDQYGIPSIRSLTKKKLEEILEENGIKTDVPKDLLNLIKKSVSLRKHMTDNNHDYTAKRGYQLTVSKILRLSHYYIEKGKLPKDWKYSAETAALLVK